MLVIMGLSCLLYDTFNYQITMQNDGRIILFHYDISRILGNGLSLAGSIISVYFDENY